MPYILRVVSGLGEGREGRSFRLKARLQEADFRGGERGRRKGRKK